MAIWNGVPFEQVVRECIVRELKEGPKNLETLSQLIKLNGENPSKEIIQQQLNYLFKKGIIQLDTYKLKKIFHKDYI